MLRERNFHSNLCPEYCYCVLRAAQIYIDDVCLSIVTLISQT